tara:strand:- start:92 stop:400 length:309 start_codon:yes stop_codon:yes gene_type:complete
LKDIVSQKSAASIPNASQASVISDLRQQTDPEMSEVDGYNNEDASSMAPSNIHSLDTVSVSHVSMSQRGAPHDAQSNMPKPTSMMQSFGGTSGAFGGGLKLH